MTFRKMMSFAVPALPIVHIISRQVRPPIQLPEYKHPIMVTQVSNNLFFSSAIVWVDDMDWPVTFFEWFRRIEVRQDITEPKF
jgi:hypothetical protein